MLKLVQYAWLLTILMLLYFIQVSLSLLQKRTSWHWNKY